MLIRKIPKRQLREKILTMLYMPTVLVIKIVAILVSACSNVYSINCRMTVAFKLVKNHWVTDNYYNNFIEGHL